MSAAGADHSDSPPMNLHRSYIVLVLFTVAACNGESTGPEVVEVRITPENPAQQVGLTVQFSAQAFDAGGQAVTGLPVTWTSNNTDIATIDESGLASALEVGTTAITATIAGVPDSEVLTVNPTLCTGRVEVVLSPGQFQSYPATTCLLLPAGGTGDRYRVAVVRPTLIQDSLDVPNVTLAIDPVLTTAAAAQPGAPVSPFSAPSAAERLIGGIDGTRFVEEARIRARTRAYHAEMRAREIELGLTARSVLRDRSALAPPAPAPAADRLELRLERECDVTTTRPAHLVAYNDFLAIYQDSVLREETALSTGSADLLLDYYTSYVRDMLDDYWGPAPDIDADGRIIVTTSPTLPDGAAAVVWSGDFLDSTDCAGSNEREIIYYANDVITGLDEDDPSYFSLGVLAHETKHVVSVYNSIQRGGFHSIWIEEGTAEISQVMSSRIAWAATGGPAVNATIDGQDIVSGAQANGGRPTPEMWALVGELADVIIQMTSHPNSLITDPVGRSEFHTFYAASWQLHRLVGDAWGDAATAPFADAPLFQQMTDPSSGPNYAALGQATGRSFDELFEDFVVAISTHETLTPSARNFTTWDLVSATDIFASPPEVAPPGEYPWPVTGSGENRTAGFVQNTFSGPIGPSGMRFHDFVSAGTASAQILVTGATNGKIIVTRLN